MHSFGGLNKKQGFTIVELLVVIVVIGILASITIVSYTGITNKAVAATISSELSNISNRIKADYVIGDLYPESLSLINEGSGISLNPDSTYFYASNNSSSPQTYCLSITKQNISYKIDNEGNVIIGDCKEYGLALSVDAGDSSSYSIGGTSWLDLSGNGRNCILYNSPTYNTDGGGSIFFDGLDDYASCGVMPIDNSYTVDAWIKPNIIGGGNSDQQNYGYTIAASSVSYGLWLTNKETEFLIRAFSPSVNGVSTTNAGVTNTDWVHVVSTSNRNGQTKIYANGVEKLSYIAGDTAWAGNLTIGDLRPNRSIGFNGLIAKFSVYNRVQSNIEVQNNFSSQKSRFGL